jgi:ribosome-associated toxin RatA of RatAB toxin-antitoxin module
MVTQAAKRATEFQRKEKYMDTFGLPRKSFSLLIRKPDGCLKQTEISFFERSSAMRRIQAVDEAIISCTPDRIWQAITDFSSYLKWWPSSVKIVVRRTAPEQVGSRVEIKPYGGRAFLCEVESTREGAEMRLRYSGVYRGTGVWTIIEGAGNCRVTYRIDLEIADPLMRLLSYIVSIPRLHSKLMKEVFTGLAEYVTRNKK